MIYWHGPCSNATREQSQGKNLTVVSLAVRISSTVKNLEDVGLIANTVTKVVLGAVPDTVYCF